MDIPQLQKLEKDPNSIFYPRILFEANMSGGDIEIGEERKKASILLIESMKLRGKYGKAIGGYYNEHPSDLGEFIFDINKVPKENNTKKIQCEKGIFYLEDKKKEFEEIPTIIDFCHDYNTIREISGNGIVKTLTYQRLKLLEHKFDMHKSLNKSREQATSTDDPKDFSNVVKIDTHIHLAAAMTSQHLFNFIKHKVKNHPSDVVYKDKEGKEITLSGLFDKENIDVNSISVSALDVRADNTFNRFDNFNAKYSPFGLSDLRTIFLKSTNYMNGRYFAEITNELFEQMEKEQFIYAEYRISVYGSERNEWDLLAKWVVDHKLYSDKNRWLVQLPRVYDVWRKFGKIKNFQELLDNVFIPLWEVTLDPSSHPELHILLQHVVGIDSVDDESKLEPPFISSIIPGSPLEWDGPENPSYPYWCYYTYANLATLNLVRKAKGFTVLDFRPHSGESGSVDHLSAAFLTAKHINHGINLVQNTPLQYLYYLAQIGLSVSPLSNHALFMDYKDNPFLKFFKRGLNVTLTTDDPLQFHLTQTPLLEEYSIASQRWNLTECDMSEIARNSVIQSGFEHSIKKKLLGEGYYKPGIDGNDISFSNISDIRVNYRWESLKSEIDFLKNSALFENFKRPTKDISFQKGLEAIYTRIKLKAMGSLTENSITVSENSIEAANAFKKALMLRSFYQEKMEYLEVKSEKIGSEKYDTIPRSDVIINNDRGVFNLYKDVNDKPLFKVPSVDKYWEDLQFMIDLGNNGPTNSFAKRRLEILTSSFRTHIILNSKIETKSVQFTKRSGDQILRVDTHVHAASAMTSRHLLQFIKKKLKEEPDVIVNGNKDTLSTLFKKLGFNEKNLTLDSLGVKAEDTYKRFDKFNAKYNPFGSTDLRGIFLKKDNYVDGRYFATLLKESLERSSKHTFFEYRISVYGKSMDDWNCLANWAIKNDLIQPEKNTWVVQVPRNYHLLRDSGHVKNYQEFLDNIFLPLFEVSIDPAKNPALHIFLQNVSGLDSVDHENSFEKKFRSVKTPTEWTEVKNPPYSYYLYYMYANIITLNHLRRSRGLRTLKFRPHCGSVGQTSHLCSAFLLADNITHGLTLAHNPSLQYIYYLSQIGISMSPLSENSLYCKYASSPFYPFFERGLNVTLSSDNPLQLHLTEEPLTEEYAIATQMFRLTTTDFAEIARNSVLISGFPHYIKQQWLGDKYNFGLSGNDINKTNVSNIRLSYRKELLDQERNLISKITQVDHLNGSMVLNISDMKISSGSSLSQFIKASQHKEIHIHKEKEKKDKK